MLVSLALDFFYNTGVEIIWDSMDNAASLVFFLDEGELFIKINVYKENSAVNHLQIGHSLLLLY